LKNVAIIPARGGSKGIPRKNLLEICGKPLIAWSILQALNATEIQDVWVTSDDEEILKVANEYGARVIKRPSEISGDDATSESAWRHAVNFIEDLDGAVDLIIAMQATSPLRESHDLDRGVRKLRDEGYDSILSATEVEDFFTWRILKDCSAQSVNYDYRLRKRRQNIEKRYLENGSFYVFRPEMLRSTNNRLGGRVGISIMDRHKAFQIDNPEDVLLCSAIMSAYGIDKTYE